MRTAPSQLRKPSYAGPGRRTGPLGAGRTVVQPRLPAQRARRLRGGAAEARGFLTLYEPLAAKSPQHLSTCADARARLAWMLANAFPTNTDMGPPSDHEKRAVATCEQLVVALCPDLARVHCPHAEVLRILDGEGSPASVAAYAACVREYQSLGPLTGNSQRLCADGALRLAYGYAANDAHAGQRGAAQEAMPSSARRTSVRPPAACDADHASGSSRAEYL